MGHATRKDGEEPAADLGKPHRARSSQFQSEPVLKLGGFFGFLKNAWDHDTTARRRKSVTNSPSISMNNAAGSGTVVEVVGSEATVPKFASQ